ncbi:hypothetical protein YYC_02455 [Plasmodium yoelii 17X]|uniref:Uncharacterized protein n=4 Tax=Plasmodium yoelii TaxID=5861 RepID=A0AAF0B1Z7_PLAYO|nr:conserved Plasmodium protein, unknown function [Plasmodium yoelii]EAA22722.1 hypothetical protein [Plasmodium yoelii yoelii]ETB60081.1 hypothetical protein YYC_02455 [Plasmodium yoelii 17X]WBY56908.1 hypothetical protein Py17XNL_000801904 [Plasmodium yoelii yoelii]CDU17707.1 conserved Plasmodium protein, unknown function [Plasmodium yoelii]VTZ77694.1 conserved Plasmodium protein, unknown function [Plasmodium yoelii]|eukprot:XP_731157.1 conserved Plasmodium protein, unknown function [Plasmodium yoelii]
MVKLHDLNTDSYDAQNDCTSLYIGNIFSEIKDEIKNTVIGGNLQNGNYIKDNYKELYSINQNNTDNNENKNGKYNNDLMIDGSNKFVSEYPKINIQEYVNFISNKKNEYKKKKKEYVIKYINYRKLKNFHYKDMEYVFKKYSEFLCLEEKCLLCDNYLSFSYLYLNIYLKSKNNYNENVHKYKKSNNNLLTFCECLESIEYSVQYTSGKKDNCYIDMIHLFKENAYFSLDIHKNIIIKEFIKNVKFTEIYKYNSLSENYYNTFSIKKKNNMDTKYINVCQYIEKPQLTIDHVKALNTHVEIFTPLFKIHNVNTLLTTVEKKLLIDCLKVTKKFFFCDKIDKLTVIIFCYLSNLYNIVMRLNAEYILCCYSQKHLEYFLYYSFQKNAYPARKMKILAIKIYKNDDEKNEDIDL